MIHVFTSDSYIYFAERNESLRNQSENQRRKILGARNAKALIPNIDIILPTSKVWIRVRRNQPAKFALELKNVNLPQTFTCKINDSVQSFNVVNS